MAHHGVKKGRATIGVNMPEKMADELERRAAAMQLSKNNYCEIILFQWIESGGKLTLPESTAHIPPRRKPRR